MRNPFLLLLTIVFIPSGFALSQDVIDESKAIEQIEGMGGRVTRDPSQTGNPVIDVSFEDGLWKIGAGDLAFLNQLEGFRTISLADPRKMDAALKENSALKGLFRTNVDVTPLPGSELQVLSNLHKLQSLRFWVTAITDDELLEVSRIRNLTALV